MEEIYIKLKSKVRMCPNEKVKLGDVMYIIAKPALKEKIENMTLYQLTEKDNSHVIFDVMHMIKEIKKHAPQLSIQSLGGNETIVEIQIENHKKRSLLFIFAWLLMFVGSALAIIYFHEDVGMRGVHQRIYYFLTGKKEQAPLLFQVPYSLGLGIGMILFFNRIFKNKINEEPSPLDVEMHEYQQSIDQYMIYYEKKEEFRDGDTEGDC